MRYSHLTHPRVLKSILKKNKQLSTDNENGANPKVTTSRTVQSESNVKNREELKSTFNFGGNGSPSSRHLMNSQLNRLSFDDGQDLDTHSKQKGGENNKVLQNGVVFKSSGDLQTHRVRVDIH